MAIGIWGLRETTKMNRKREMRMEMAMEEDIPLVNWPQESGIYQVVQFRLVAHENSPREGGPKELRPEMPPVEHADLPYIRFPDVRFPDEARWTPVQIGQAFKEELGGMDAYRIRGFGACILDLERKIATFGDTGMHAHLGGAHIDQFKRSVSERYSGWNIYPIGNAGVLEEDVARFGMVCAFMRCAERSGLSWK